MTETSVSKQKLAVTKAGSGAVGGRALVKSPVPWPDVAHWIVVLGDVGVIFLGLFLGFWIRFHSRWIPENIRLLSAGPARSDTPTSKYFGLFALGEVLLLGTFLTTHVYDRLNLLRVRRSAGLMCRALLFWLVAYLAVTEVLRFTPEISKGYLLISVVSCGVCLVSWRYGYRWFLRRTNLLRQLSQKVLFVGWSPEASRLLEALTTDPDKPYRIMGCLPTKGGQFAHEPPSTVARLGDGSLLSEVLRTRMVDVVIYAEREPPTSDVLSIANRCEREHVQFKLINNYFQILASGLHLESINGVTLLGVSRLPLDLLHNRCLKRCGDILGSLVGLVLLSPVILISALLVAWESPGSVLFSQERVGRGGRLFQMFKIRSMRLGAEHLDHLSQSTDPDDPRLLRVGRFLRRWNIDELPQFWNVLKGDMSLVGPRPERTLYSERLSNEIPHYQARYNAKPGMTGWAQAHGLRGNTDLVERNQHDLWYLENWSLWIDLQILVMTLLPRNPSIG